MPFIDVHCHIDFSEFGTDRDDVLRRAEAVAVIAILNPGVTVESSGNAAWLAKEHVNIYSGVGIHPHEAVHFFEAGGVAREKIAHAVAALEKLVGSSRLVAVGEIGLDFYRLADTPLQNGRASIKDVQRELLNRQLDLAQRANLPVILHCRNAYDEMLEILKVRPGLQGVVHCFEGSPEIAQKFLDLGFFISFTNNVGYKKSRSLDAAKVVPLDRLLIETDAPFLPPEALRGKRCEPAHVVNVARTIAEARGIPVEEIGVQTTANARKLFGLAI